MGKLEDEYKRLNKAQREAVDQTEGPVLVVAGAGTGKTRVIVERISKLIDGGVDPSSILALTFTEKAAGEMLDRINAGKTGVSLDTTVATFNRFGNNLLEEYGAEYGLGRLKLLGDTGQLVFLREHLDDFNLDYFSPVSSPDSQLEVLARYISLLKQQLVTPEQYKKYADKLPQKNPEESLERQKHQELAEFFDAYLKLCRSEQVIDYDDQIYLAIEMLEGRPNILKALRERYRYTMVDEFQDTNPMQSRLVDLLAGSSQNIMVVGDDDQSIYGWRGATLANILDFKKRYPKAAEVTLIENYRSTQQILDAAYRLIQFNNPNRLEEINKINKRLHAQSKGSNLVLQHFMDYDGELTWIARDISRRLKAGEDPGSIAVLSRRNSGVDMIHEALELYDIPHRTAGINKDVYAQPGVKQLIEGLKCIADPLDNTALFHTLSGPLFGLEVSKLATLSGQANRRHQPLSRVIEQDGSTEARQALSQINKWRESAQEQGVVYVAYKLMDESGWMQRIYKRAEDPEVVREARAFDKFFRTLKEFERIAGAASVQQYVVNLPTLQAAGNNFDDGTLDIADDQVNILSIHRAKGLEWRTVYITDCTEGSFPLKNFGSGLKLPMELQANPSEADEHMAEERRLMYVAATRAKQELVLTYSDRHGSGTQRKPSRFLTELIGHEPSLEVINESVQTNLSIFAPSTAPDTAALPEKIYHDDRIHLNVSEIETWLRCPQDFYYRYVLSMPLQPAPQLEYGSLIHSVIEQIHKGRASNNIPSLDQLINEVSRELPRTGYVSRKSRERHHAQALKTVKAVYDRFIGDNLPIETEWPFTLEVADLPLTITGKIDAVYELDDGVEIRDFKTGTSVKTPEQAKSRVSGSQQLTLYALAWKNLRGNLPAKLTLDYVETGQTSSVKKQQRSLDSLETKLDAMVKQLLAGQYPPGRDHTFCMHPAK